VRAEQIRPTGLERAFAEDEIIVSKTDLKGRLTYVNDVFVRVSAFDEEALIGRPHNVIRHPDMPRALFRLLWETLEARRELFAYIVNLAADGAHYWVLAHVTPTLGASGQAVGYHSNRRTASREALDRVVPLYQELLQVERANGGAQQSTAASVQRLNDRLEEWGLSYDEWVWSLDTAGTGVAA
jgi:PAS domain S-box-containing protein